MELTPRKPNDLTPEEDLEIGEQVDLLIDRYKDSRRDMLRLSAECVAFSTATEARASSMAKQRLIKRLWNGITGKNHKLQAANDRDLAKAQYAAQQTIVRLAEQNALTFEMVVSIGNRVNYVAGQIGELWKELGKFAARTKDQLSELARRTGRLETRQKLLFWKETIEDGKFEDQPYDQLPETAKLVCLVNDFYDKTKGDWDGYQDLVFFRLVMKEIGLNHKALISPMRFIRELDGQPALKDRLFAHLDCGPRDLESPLHSPVMAALAKLEALGDGEGYIVDTVVRQLQAHNVEIDAKEVAFNLVSDYLQQTTDVNAGAEVEMFAFAIELLAGLRVLTPATDLSEVETVPMLPIFTPKDLDALRQQYRYPIPFTPVEDKKKKWIGYTAYKSAFEAGSRKEAHHLRITKWRVKPGDSFVEGTILCIYDFKGKTRKTRFLELIPPDYRCNFCATESGRLLEIVVEENDNTFDPSQPVAYFTKDPTQYDSRITDGGLHPIILAEEQVRKNIGIYSLFLKDINHINKINWYVNEFEQFKKDDVIFTFDCFCYCEGKREWKRDEFYAPDDGQLIEQVVLDGDPIELGRPVGYYKKFS